MSSSNRSNRLPLEQQLLPATECFVYKVPKLTSATATSRGHRAELWDLAKVAVENTFVRVVLDGEDGYRTLRIQIYYHHPKESALVSAVSSHLEWSKLSESSKLFAECVLNLYLDRKKKLEFYVEDVVDSSRYFVLRLIHPTNKVPQILIGIGFRERHEAINFKECLYGYVSSIQRDILAEEMQMATKDNDLELNENKDDQENKCTTMISKLTLKEGEKIHVKVNGRSRTSRSETKKDDSATCISLSGLLRPPPSALDASSKITTKPNEKERKGQSIEENDDDDDDDEWGDFEGA